MVATRVEPAVLTTVFSSMSMGAVPTEVSTAGRPRPLARPLALALAPALALALAGCAVPAAHGISTVAGLYPFAYVLERVGGPDIGVTNLTKPGAEPHDLELTPRQVAAVETAGLVVYLPGLQPAVDDAVRTEARHHSLDIADAVSLLPAPTALGGGSEDNSVTDPHVWLDPLRMVAITDAVASRLATIDPAHASGYRDRAAALRKDLIALDAQYRQGLKTCARHDIVTSHAAFGYLAERYGLTQVGVGGLDPEQEPSPRRIAEVTTYVRQRGVTTIYFETLVSPKVAQTVAAETGAHTAVLDPIEGLPAGSKADYLTVMRANLAALRSGLGCR
jgi:zinc transport system substrate-binding protein